MEIEAYLNRRVHELSDAFAQKAVAPSVPQLDFWDDEIKGLMLRCFRSGKKSWCLRYWSDGRKRFIVLGRFPGMSCKRARSEATKKLAGKVLGTDPTAERDARRAAKTFAELAELYLTKHAAVNKKSADADRRTIEHDLLPRLGQLKAAEITQTDILDVLDAIVDRDARVLANRARTLLGTIFRFGIKRAIIKPHENPCTYVDARPGGKETPRDRVLSDDEIKAVWAGCDAEPLGNAARLALLTGQREMEIFGMEFSELDLNKGVWEIPASRSKNKKPHTVPLVGAALGILRGIEAGEHDALRVFPGANASRVAALMRRLREVTGIADWRFHDLRRTVATGISKLDYRLGIIVAKLLNHSSKGVTDTTYIHNPLDDEKRAALIRWDRHIDEVINGKPASNVIELRAS
jgi:integrase